MKYKLDIFPLDGLYNTVYFKDNSQIFFDRLRCSFALDDGKVSQDQPCTSDVSEEV